jgi:23S rRNA (adenine2503-C2)-methyltransferase
MVRKNLIGLSAEEIFAIIEPEGFTRAHALSVSHSIYKKRISDTGLFESVPKKLRAFLGKDYAAGLFEATVSEQSADGAIKYLFRTADGRLFESVCLPEAKRYTVCVSTQSGCRMGCSCCVTAGYGYHGDLSAGEIVNQVISHPDAAEVTHVVMMGMGEPMDNLDNVLQACRILTSEWGLALSSRHVTVSTVGLTPGIIRFLDDSDCNLALSLFSPFAEEREKLVPAERKYPVSDIVGILKNHKLRKNRRISLAYVMLKDVNDTDRHLNGLKSLVEGTSIRINLLPYHPSARDSSQPSSPERLMLFKHELVTSGVSASVRKSRGEDISAACGLLATGLKEGRKV